MSHLLIPDLEEKAFLRLNELAAAHGRSAEAEARAILEEALRLQHASGWAGVDEIYDRLAVSGRAFGDSTDLLREDRDR